MSKKILGENKRIKNIKKSRCIVLRKRGETNERERDRGKKTRCGAVSPITKVKKISAQKRLSINVQFMAASNEDPGSPYWGLRAKLTQKIDGHFCDNRPFRKKE